MLDIYLFFDTVEFSRERVNEKSARMKSRSREKGEKINENAEEETHMLMTSIFALFLLHELHNVG